MKLVRATGITHDQRIVDIGGGASTLVDHLLEEGFHNITVVDVSPRALEYSRARLGSMENKVTWIEGDITVSTLADRYDLWHDRAVFHFLTARTEREAYLRLLNRSLNSRGHVVISTFSMDGPEKCSGLPVVRYSTESLSKEIGEHFEIGDTVPEIHKTPSGAEQRFIYCRFQKKV